MARKVVAKDQIVKLIIGAGQASPSPPVGPALGSKGVKSMDFCKEFNALTAHINTGTPLPTRITVRPDRSFAFTVRTPPTATLLLAAANVPASKGGKVRGANAPGRALEPLAAGAASASGSAEGAVSDAVRMVAKSARGAERPAGAGGGSAQVGTVSLKHVWEIARIKLEEERLRGLGMEGMVRSVVAQARTIGIGVVP